MNKLKFFLKSQAAVWGLVVVVLAAGYYLRAYFYLNYHYDFSPYDALLARHGINIFNVNFEYDMYTFKSFSYPLSYFLKYSLGVLNNIYLVYLIGAIVIFRFGKLFGGNFLGGVLAVLFFAVAPENLLQYTKDITPAGVNYVLMWSSLFFFFKYLKQGKDANLFWFSLTAMFAFVSYHTGAAALAVILLALLLTILLTEEKADSKLVAVILSLLAFYVFWLLFFDLDQITLIRGALFRGKVFLVLMLLLGVASIISVLKKIFNFSKYHWLASPWFIVLSLSLGMLLIFMPAPIFNKLLFLGVVNYSSSALTLNNYLAQALIGHVYLLTLPIWWSKFDRAQRILLTGWLSGLAIILTGLILEDYYARIFDYSFPLLFLLFGYFWSQQPKLRRAVVALTIILLFISEIFIFNDPFSLRRYYTPEEVRAAQKAIDHGINYRTVSDLRTSALFQYLGETKVEFLEDYYHNIIFYDYDEIKPGIKQRQEENIYLVVSDAMRNIVYGVNFQTTPLTDDFYQYFEQNFGLYFDAGEFKIYQLK